MRSATVLVLVLPLAACSKSEPPPVQAETTAAIAAAPAEDSPAAAALAETGGKLFRDNCATCHMADGGGVPYLQPPITGSAWISAPDPQLLLTLILRGSAVLGAAALVYENDMAPLAHLTDDELAALATYVRNRFASAPPARPVTPAEVAVARARPGLP